MGKLVVTEFMSLDGVMQAPGGEDFKYPGWSFAFDRGEDGNQFSFAAASRGSPEEGRHRRDRPGAREPPARASADRSGPRRRAAPDGLPGHPRHGPAAVRRDQRQDGLAARGVQARRAGWCACPDLRAGAVARPGRSLGQKLQGETSGGVAAGTVSRKVILPRRSLATVARTCAGVSTAPAWWKTQSTSSS
jgi:hypothetical protein